MGGREHYAIPRALHAADALNLLMTDYWAGVGTRALAMAFPGKTSRSLAARQHPEIPCRLVKSWNLDAFAWEAQLRRMTHDGGVTGRYRGYCEVGRRFGNAMVRHLRSNSCLPEFGVFFGYCTGSLEVMVYLKERGVACIVDQIDPCRVEYEMVRAEQVVWKGWEDLAFEIPDELYERHSLEWEIADRVVVNSEWSRQALIRQGVSPEKLAVIPLCYEADAEELKPEMLKFKATEHHTAETPLRVLFLGQVVLRKGIQYLVEAARLLQHEPVRFDIVGPIHISEMAVSSAPSNVVFHGRATRDQIGNWYRRADVFVLPTLSDGFAITQIEAMANGLPVIATSNCGAVVSDGVDGFLVAPRDPRALASAICRYLEKGELLDVQSQAARVKAGQFSLREVGAKLLDLATEIHPGASGRNSHA